MENMITNIPPESPDRTVTLISQARVIPQNMVNPRTDRVELGNNEPVTTADATRVIYDRAMARLQGVVDDARAQLGLEPAATLDTSVEATAGRIVDFVVRAFEGWRDSRPEMGEEEAREEYVSFITPAIEQGVREAEDILSALQALSPEVQSNITAISDLINEQLAGFVSGVD